MTKTVVELDLAGYSDTVRVVEQNLNAEATSQVNAQIQRFIDAGLAAAGVERSESVIKTTGDGAILIFDDPAPAHKFAVGVNKATAGYNSEKTELSAKRFFRIGAATGDVAMESEEGGGRDVAGGTVGRARRLQEKANRGQLLVDAYTYQGLCPAQQKDYGCREIVVGKRTERFEAYRCVLDRDAPRRSGRGGWLLVLVAVLALVACFATWVLSRGAVEQRGTTTAPAHRSPVIVLAPVSNWRDCDDQGVVDTIRRWSEKQQPEDDADQLGAVAVLAECEQERAALKSAICRMQSKAEADDRAVVAALETARKSGDPTRLLPVLEFEVDRCSHSRDCDPLELRELRREAAAVAVQCGDTHAARKHLTEIISTSPGDAAVLNQLGGLCLGDGDLDEAENYFERVLDLATAGETFEATALGNMGVIAMKKEELVRAEGLFGQSRAIETRPEGIAADCSNLAFIRIKQGALAQAQDLLHEAIAAELKSKEKWELGTYRGNLAFVCRAQGQQERAIEMLQLALATDRQLGRPTNILRHLELSSSIYELNGRLPDAIRGIEEALNVAKQLRSPAHIARYTTALVRLRAAAGEYGVNDEASDRRAIILGPSGVIEMDLRASARRSAAELEREEEDIRSALEASEVGGLGAVVAGHLGNLAINQMRQGNYAEARGLFVRALSAFEEVNDPTGMSRQCSNLASMCSLISDLRGAEEWSGRAMSVATRAGDKRAIATAHRVISQISYKKGELGSARTSSVHALELYVELGDDSGAAEAHAELAVIAAVQKDWETVETHRRAQLANCRRTGDREGEADAFFGIGWALHQRRDLPLATEFLEQARRQYMKLKRLPELGQVLLNLGLVARDQGRLDDAQEHTRDALDLFADVGSLEGQANAFANLGAFAEDQGDFESARDCWRKARGLFGEAGNTAAQSMLDGWFSDLDKRERNEIQTRP